MYLRSLYENWRNKTAVSNRTRRFGLAIGSSLLSKGATIILQIGVMPIAIRKLGIEQYGIYAFLTSFLNLISFSELGIGPRLIRTISHFEISGDRTAQRKAVSSAFFLIAILGITLALLVSVGIQIVPMSYLVRPEYQNYAIIIRQCIPVVCVIGVILLLGIIFQRIQAGFQELHHANLSCGIGNLVTIVGVISFYFLPPSVMSLILCFYLGQILASIGNAVWLLNRRPWLVPSFLCLEGRSAMLFFQEGIQISMNQSVLPLLQRDFSQLVLLRMTGPATAGQFAVCLQMTTLLGGIIGLFTAPLYGAISDAVAKREFDWIKKCVRRLLAFCGVYCVLLMLIFFFIGQKLMFVWLGNRSPIMTQGELTVFTFYFTVTAFKYIYYVMIISIRYIWLLTVVSIMEAVVSVVFVLIMARSYGLFGVLLVLTTVTLLSCILYPLIYRNVFREQLRVNGMPTVN